VFLVYGQEGIGKTTLLSQEPGVLFLTTEPGTRGMRIYENRITSWRQIKSLVKQLQATDRFPCVVLDTVDVAYDLCLDYVCQKLSIPYPGQDESGREDYGKSWKAVKKEFMSIVFALINSGRGVRFISHYTESEVQAKSGGKYTRIVPSMGKQARLILTALADFVFYCEKVRGPNGEVQRVIFTQGDETIFAKARRTAFGEFPAILPMPKEGGYDVLVQGFRGKHPGLDPLTLQPARDTAKSSATFLTRLAHKAAKQKHGKGE